MLQLLQNSLVAGAPVSNVLLAQLKDYVRFIHLSGTSAQDLPLINLLHVEVTCMVMLALAR